MTSNATTPAATNKNQELDQAFARRIHTSILTAQAWDDDPSLLFECRAMLPWEELQNETGKYAEPDKDRLRFANNRNIRFLQRLARFFQRDFMTWVNQPPCVACQGKNVKYQCTRGPETLEEKQGGASRVEVYQCQDCADETTTTFPRYNVPRKLLETRRGRCGEYANLFGCMCRAVGFDTRYISDFTDHVWTEVRVVHEGVEQWIMVDSCEGVVNEPSMYEAGWGKKLNYVLAIHANHCMDVTWRYTRQGHTEEFMTRRREHASSEVASESIVKQSCKRLMAGLKPKERDELQKRLDKEASILSRCRQAHEWTTEYDKGRISGSLQWKLDRKEAGKKKDLDENAEKKGNTKVVGYSVETFMPLTSNDITIAVHPYPSSPREGIVVSWTACAVGQADALSVVVVDNQCLGCILQSRSFCSMDDLVDFVETVPNLRCFAIVGKLPREKVKTTASKALPELLPAFKLSAVEDGVLYIGQKCASPDWAFCGSFEESPKGHQIRIGGRAVPSRDLSLRTIRNVQPASVVGRLPGDWSKASEAEKRQGFLSFKDFVCSGYCTKPGMPVYLLGETAFPLQKCNEDGGDENGSNWNTFLWWPTPMVPESDHGLVETLAVDPSLLVKVPLDLDFFHGLFGPALQTKSGNKPTGEVLENSRLVGLYFSASWCGPCHRFTPVLAEMYETLKESHPSHGLEIVFISSDRDANGFNGYYSSMPWTALPFENMFFKANLSTRFGVKGIPFLVILDTVSGQVVVPGSSTRQEVIGACQRGDIAIENMFQDWLYRLPAETKEIMSMLEVSCTEDRIKFTSAEGDGESPRYLVAHTGNETSSPTPFEPAPVRSPEGWETECLSRVLLSGEAPMRQVLQTTLKYLENAQKEPWTPKFRSFRLSNKVADRITSIPHSVSFLETVGLEVLPAQTDYIVTIPLSLNLDELREDLEAYIEEYSS